MGQTDAAKAGNHDAAPYRGVGFLAVDLDVDHRTDGSITVTSRVPLADYDWNIPRAIRAVADANPAKTALAQREAGQGDWRITTYAQLKADCDAVTQWILDRAAAPDASLMLMGPNTPAFAAFSFGAMAAGVPMAPVSMTYALIGGDLGRLRHVIGRIRPAMLFVEDARPIAAALDSLDLGDTLVITRTPEALSNCRTVDAADVLNTIPTSAVEDHIASLKPDDHAQYLLTSGSTGLPKVVAISFDNLASNTAQGAQATGEALDWSGRMLNWMPWNHTAGASCLRATLLAGGAFYIDDGKPMPGLFEQSIRNLREIPVPYYVNVPLGFTLLADALEADPVLRKTFFSELRLMLFGGAALSQPIYDRIQKMAIEETGCRIMLTSGYGSTETTSGFMAVYAYTDKVGLGLPLPGSTIKLIPQSGDRWEIRAKGPNVTRGYLGDPERTASAFDDEGYYCMGDLATFKTPGDISQGLMFAGRLADEFKLSTGTWVYGGQVREAVVAALSPLVTDLVLCDDNQPWLGVMVWPSADGVRRELGQDLPDAIASGALAEAIRQGLALHNQDCAGSSMRIERALILSTPPNPNAHEVSDKGSINRRGVIDNRSADLTRLYADQPGADIILIKDN